MKLISSKALIDRHECIVFDLDLDLTDSQLDSLRAAYEFIYPRRAPMRVVTYDVLGNREEVDLAKRK